METITQKEIADRAREHANSIELLFGHIPTKEGYKLRSKNSYQCGFNDAIEFLKSQKDGKDSQGQH